MWRLRSKTSVCVAVTLTSAKCILFVDLHFLCHYLSFRYHYPFLVVSVLCVQDKPKEVLPVIDLNITLNSEAGHPNGMQMVAFVKGKTRNYFVYSQSAQVCCVLALQSTL
jgi:hypothetical protein